MLRHRSAVISIRLFLSIRIMEIPDASGIRGSVACATESRCAPKKKELKCVQFYGATTGYSVAVLSNQRGRSKTVTPRATLQQEIEQ